MTGWTRRLKTILPRSRFAKSVAVLAGGTALGQVITVFASPVLTRLYSPENFGILAAYASVLAMLSVVASLRYEFAIPMPAEKTEAVSLLSLSLVLVILSSVVVALSTFSFADYIVAWTHTPALKSYLWLLPVGVLGSGVYRAFNYYAIREKAYAPIAQTKLSQSFGQVFSQLLLGGFGLGAFGLIVGQILGQSAGVARLCSTVTSQGWRQLRSSRPRGLYKSAKRYRRFALFSSPGSLLNISGLQLPPLLLAALYDPQVVGWFYLSRRVVQIPMTLVGNSVSQVFVGEAAALINTDIAEYRRLLNKTFLRLLAFGVPPVVLLALLSRWLFPVLFGASWEQAGLYTQLLSLMYLAQFCVSPVSQSLNLLERQDLQLVWDALRFFLVIAVFAAGYWLDLEPSVTILLFSIVMTLSYLILLIMINASLNVYQNQFKARR